MRIDGLFEVKQSGRKFAPPWKIRVLIGRPIRFEAGKDPRAIAQELQDQVAALKSPAPKSADSTGSA
jgi:hypothetical protein